MNQQINLKTTLHDRNLLGVSLTDALEQAQLKLPFIEGIYANKKTQVTILKVDNLQFSFLQGEMIYISIKLYSNCERYVFGWDEWIINGETTFSLFEEEILPMINFPYQCKKTEDVIKVLIQEEMMFVFDGDSRRLREIYWAIVIPLE